MCVVQNYRASSAGNLRFFSLAVRRSCFPRTATTSPISARLPSATTRLPCSCGEWSSGLVFAEFKHGLGFVISIATIWSWIGVEVANDAAGKMEGAALAARWTGESWQPAFHQVLFSMATEKYRQLELLSRIRRSRRWAHQRDLYSAATGTSAGTE
jgi:hypothetical protein